MRMNIISSFVSIGLPIILLITVFIHQKTVKGFSVFDCQGSWALNTSDNEIMSKRYLNWVSISQNQCDNQKVWSTTMSGAGIGSGITISIIQMLKAIELGALYRPRSVWIWSPPDPTRECLGHIDAIDCFNIPLSSCGVNYTSQKHDKIYPTETDDFQGFIPYPTDICTQGKKTQKTMLWIFGQLIHYHIRLPSQSQKKIENSFALLFHTETRLGSQSKEVNSSNDNQHYKCRTASIHVRSGNPDQARRGFTGSEHLAILRNYNNQLKYEQKRICTVYVSGDHLQDTIFFKMYANETNNSSVFTPAYSVQIDDMVFKALPRYIADEGEIEYQISRIKSSSHITMHQIYLEYVEDIYFHSHVDYFIGSHSNMYAMIAPLREAYHPSWSNNRTCFLDSHFNPSPLICLGEGRNIAFFRGAYGGFKGGEASFHKD